MAAIQAETSEGVATLLIDNGPSGSLTAAMLNELMDHLGRFGDDDHIGALVIAGAGPNFCAGSDIGELKALNDSGRGPLPVLDLENRAFDRLAEFAKPVVAAVEGAASGGGVELLLCCDLIVVGGRARFSLPEIRLGVYPGAGGVLRLPRRIGHARALEMMLLGEDVDAATALGWGLANRLVEEGAAREEASRLARRLARGPRLAQRRLREAMRSRWTFGDEELQALVRGHAAELGASPDVAEGMRAFFARERPTFNRGR